LDLVARSVKPIQNVDVEEFIAMHEQNFIDAHRNIAVAQQRQAEYSHGQK
jgi:hypothetical protein